jgi:hypothetical protein
MVQSLVDANCQKLSVGFESMSDNTLRSMNKLVTSAENRRAFELLRDSDVQLRICTMVGYPGETPEDYELTHRFLVEEYSGHYLLSVFSFADETMPVWQDADHFGLQIDHEDPKYGWRHDGMDVEGARALHRRTLDETRRYNEDAIVLLWQTDYEIPLVPHLSLAKNMRVEKLVERLGMAPRDHATPEAAAPAVLGMLDELQEYGITLERSAPEPDMDEAVAAL